MKEDAYGLPVSTQSDTALRAYMRDLDRLLSMDDGGTPLFGDAIAADGNFALAHIAQARHLILLGRVDDARAVAARASALDAGLHDRERAHVAAVALAINGQAAAALDAVRRHVAAYPTDALVLSLALGVYGLIAFSGRRDHHREQRDLLEELAPKWPEHWWFLGFLGWSHAETGEPEAGGRIVDRSLALNGRNAQAVHARMHAYVELGDQDKGAAFLEAWLRDYKPGNMLHCHLNWHMALFELDQGKPNSAFARYMSCIRPGVVAAAGFPKLADAASLLWRMQAYGALPDPLPWREVADMAIQVFPRAGLTFADLHAAMACAAAGDSEALERRIDELDQALASGKLRQGEIVPALCRALGAYVRGEDAEVIRLIDGALPELPRVAGSHAQREVFEDTLISACLRAKRTDRARELLTRRLARRPRRQDAKWLETLEASL